MKYRMVVLLFTVALLLVAFAPSAMKRIALSTGNSVYVTCSGGALATQIGQENDFVLVKCNAITPTPTPIGTPDGIPTPTTTPTPTATPVPSEP